MNYYNLINLLWLVPLKLFESKKSVYKFSNHQKQFV